MSRRARLLLCVLAFAACQPIVRDFGYVPPPEDLATVEVGQDTRETVAQKLGLPLHEGLGESRAWYYVESRQETFGPGKPRTVARDIVAVRFAEDGAVENIERFDVSAGRVVRLTARVTDSAVSELGILRQIFGNIGTPQAEDFLGDQ